MSFSSHYSLNSDEEEQRPPYILQSPKSEPKKEQEYIDELKNEEQEDQNISAGIQLTASPGPIKVLSVLDVNTDHFESYPFETQINTTKIDEDLNELDAQQVDSCNDRKERRQKRKREKDRLSKRTHNIDLNTQPDEAPNNEFAVVKEEPSLELLETEPVNTNENRDLEMELMLQETAKIDQKQDEDEEEMLINEQHHSNQKDQDQTEDIIDEIGDNKIEDQMEDELLDNIDFKNDIPMRQNSRDQDNFLPVINDSPQFYSPQRQQSQPFTKTSKNQEDDLLDANESPRRQVSHPSQLLLASNIKGDRKSTLSIIELTSINQDLQKLLFDDSSQISKPSGRNIMDNMSITSGRNQPQPFLRIKKTLKPRQSEEMSNSARSSAKHQQQQTESKLINRTITKNLRDIQVKRKHELNETRQSFSTIISEIKILEQLKKETQDFQSIRPPINITIGVDEGQKSLQETMILSQQQHKASFNNSMNQEKANTPESLKEIIKPKKVNVISKKNLKNLKLRLNEQNKKQNSSHQSAVLPSRQAKDFMLRRSNSQTQKNNSGNNSQSRYNLRSNSRENKRTINLESSFGENILAQSIPHTTKNSFKQSKLSSTMTNFSKVIKQNNLFESQTSSQMVPRLNQQHSDTSLKHHQQPKNKPPIAQKGNKKQAQRQYMNSLESFKNLQQIYSGVSQSSLLNMSSENRFTINNEGPQSKEKSQSNSRYISPQRSTQQLQMNNSINLPLNTPTNFYPSLNGNLNSFLPPQVPNKSHSRIVGTPGKNIINTNHNSYVMFGVNIIQKSQID
ncbi:UNKNOWN [Stylonychia lemnae]|uniref:Uncharacterized protein n=1 Tax=Stylonychia lemnae TaxID=5949 RepID=A0A078AE61_STYLE|nr:UNKNOWN [Stylonychia lemnae]|eukprot:CDW79203.1 UNKNOWN [Stylonychia lemnae]